MKSKKIDKPKIRDLRDLASVKLAVPDVSGELAGSEPPPDKEGPRMLTPDIGVQTPGQTTHG